MAVTLDRKTLETILVHVSLSTSSTGHPKSLGMRTGHVLEIRRQFRAGSRTNHEVPVVGHELVRKDRQRDLLVDFSHELFEFAVIIVCEEESLPLHTPIQNVVVITRFEIPSPIHHRTTLRPPLRPFLALCRPERQAQRTKSTARTTTPMRRCSRRPMAYLAKSEAEFIFEFIFVR